MNGGLGRLDPSTLSWLENNIQTLERGVKPGEVRMMRDALFYASEIYRHRWPKKDVVWWQRIAPAAALPAPDGATR